MLKTLRLQEFLHRLEHHAVANTEAEALGQIASVLNAIEEEHCPADEERMGPPLDDNRRSVPDHPGVARYRNKGHNTFVRDNGAIRIEEVSTKQVVLDKPGGDGRRVFDS